MCILNRSGSVSGLTKVYLVLQLFVKCCALRRSWEDNIKTALTWIVWEGVNWIDLGQDEDKTGYFERSS